MCMCVCVCVCVCGVFCRVRVRVVIDILMIKKPPSVKKILMAKLGHSED